MKKTLSVIFMLLLMSAAFQSCREAEGTAVSLKRDIPRPVKVLTLNEPRDSITQVLPGVARSARETTLSFRVSGPLVFYTAETGKPVRKGDVIARIDDRDYRLRLKQAQAARTSANATLVEARLQFDRYSALLEDGAVAKAEFDRARAARDTAAAALNNAVAAVDNAENQLADTVLTAPYTGVIHDEYAEIHQRVNVGEPIIRMIDLTDIEVVVGLPSAMLPRAGDISSIRCTFSALDDASFEAVIREVGQKADAGSRTFPVILSVCHPSSIRPGMTADVRFCLRSKPGFLIPASAMVPGENGGTSVFVVNDGLVEKRAVTVGSPSPSGIPVHGDLKSGERVVVAGAVYLKPGQKVRPLDEPSGTNVGSLL